MVAAPSAVTSFVKDRNRLTAVAHRRGYSCVFRRKQTATRQVGFPAEDLCLSCPETTQLQVHKQHWDLWPPFCVSQQGVLEDRNQLLFTPITRSTIFAFRSIPPAAGVKTALACLDGFPGEGRISSGVAISLPFDP